MGKIIFAVCFLLTSFSLNGQNTLSLIDQYKYQQYFDQSFSEIKSGNFDLKSFNNKRIKDSSYGMFVLGTWAVGNIAWGLIGQSNSVGIEKGFHQMNAGWNLVNLGIAGLGYWPSEKMQENLMTSVLPLKHSKG